MKMNKSRYIQLIHVGKNKLGWDDELYRSNLVALTKKNSCSDMSANELSTVLEFMKSKGFKPVSVKGKHSPKTRGKVVHSPIDKLRQLWIAMKSRGYLRDGSDDALLAWSKDQAKRLNHNVAIDRLEWLKPTMLHHLIEQLKAWYKRKLIEDVKELTPELRKLKLDRHDSYQAQKVHELEDLSKCNIEQLEKSVSFIGQMLGKYEGANNAF
ncbi:gp16 family protein [Pseudoalteromonas luteoviolacea]|uniref:gp16 family protein n=1 Tax=Pseudoalteromonas luteoviolacea TaxID=43657 RepID=UPI00114F5EED|nr:regulatory protein GemA [Pseudoalteromonas luteoviolacea]TQF69583.1 regulatory protein GemA [Pseudoalteromonas luteoviolacea]